MSITMQNPRVIHLGGEITRVNDRVASGAITPGMLLQRASGKVAVHAVAAGNGPTLVALEASMFNRGIDDAYADGELVEAGVLQPGATAYMLIPSGQNIADGALLESAGTGKLQAVSGSYAKFQALEAVNNSAGPGDARIRVEAL